MVKVRYAGRPWEELEVSEVEADDLRRMGALAQDKPVSKSGEQAPPADAKPNK
jgi:hypothetical protein